jgi:hypothetical protein
MTAALGSACRPTRFALGSVQDTVQAEPEACEAPAPKMVEHRLPGRKVGGQIAPRAAGAHHIEDGVEDAAQRTRARSATPGPKGKIPLHRGPLVIGEATRIVGVHAGQSTKLCRLAALQNTPRCRCAAAEGMKMGTWHVWHRSSPARLRLFSRDPLTEIGPCIPRLKAGGCMAPPLAGFSAWCENSAV